MSKAANDGLQYPTTFNEFMGVVDRWHRARGHSPRPGESLGGMLERTADELEDAVTMFRQVWENAERGRRFAAPGRMSIAEAGRLAMRKVREVEKKGEVEK